MSEITRVMHRRLDEPGLPYEVLFEKTINGKTYETRPFRSDEPFTEPELAELERLAVAILRTP